MSHYWSGSSYRSGFFLVPTVTNSVFLITLHNIHAKNRGILDPLNGMLAHSATKFIIIKCYELESNFYERNYVSISYASGYLADFLELWKFNVLCMRGISISAKFETISIIVVACISSHCIVDC